MKAQCAQKIVTISTPGTSCARHNADVICLILYCQAGNTAISHNREVLASLKQIVQACATPVSEQEVYNISLRFQNLYNT